MEKKKFNNAIEKAENLSDDTQKVITNTANGKIFYNNQTPQNFDLNDSGNKSGNEELYAMSAKEQEKAIRLREIEERKRARKLLKEEAKRHREERIYLQNKDKIEALKEKERQKAQLKAEKERAKMEYKNQKLTERREKRRMNASRGIGGWLAAVIALSCVCLVLTTVVIHDKFMSGGGEAMLSNVYARSFYDLMGCIDNIDVNLNKLTVANGNKNKQRILGDVIVQANLAEASLETLPIEQRSVHSTAKFINQVGDFSKYLNNKLINGESISEEDLSTLKSMQKINSELRVKLKNLAGELGDDFDFMTLLSGEENMMIEYFNELEYHSVEYPKMIYDGPFADEPDKNSTNAEIKEGEKISEEKAVQLFNEYFSSYSLQECKVTGVGESKDFTVYNIEGKTDEYDLFAQLLADGRLVMFDSYTRAENKNLTRDECIENAYKFLQKCGYKSIKAVWSNVGSDNMTYINFASTTQNGEIVLYSDLIKVAVCMNNGRVCDMDAHLYLKNHKEREIPEVKIKVEDAERKLNENLEVQTSRLALIPTPSNKEILAYEFSGIMQGETYYVYVNAITGEEEQIFKVVSTDDGDLLL